MDDERIPWQDDQDEEFWYRDHPEPHRDVTEWVLATLVVSAEPDDELAA